MKSKLIILAIFISIFSFSTRLNAQHYEIEGFYVSELTDIHLNYDYKSVKNIMGKPKQKLKNKFEEPNRVKLSELPEFDEQWFYDRGMGYDWIFFKNGIVVAAFSEDSDF